MLKRIFSAGWEALVGDPVPDSEAYREGYRAFFNSPTSTSPHPAGTKEHADWLHGQLIAKADRQW